MFRSLNNQARLVLKIQPVSPVLVKSAGSGLDPTRPEMEFVTIHTEAKPNGHWDTHENNFAMLKGLLLPFLDRGLSALIDDLSDRGLLAETIVVAKGEFGRTPKINNKAGRDHWEKCSSALVAGGGIRGGQVIGASDRHGEHPVSRAVTPQMP